MGHDLTVCYAGGSGGFFALHCLLLSGKYECVFKENLSFEEAFEKQWNINNPKNWISYEVWPQNEKTFELETEKNKIYFFCNPTKEKIKEFDCTSLLIYTDIKTQSSLAEYKNASWFANGQHNDNKQDEIIKLIYNNIKADFWPDCDTYEKYIKLPKPIFDEFNEFLKSEGIDLQKYEKSFINEHTINFNNIIIEDKLEEIIDIVNKKILLQDIVKSKAKNLYSLLNLEYHQKVSDFVHHWTSLHPAHIQNLLLGEIK